jgi:hypothetical protein
MNDDMTNELNPPEAELARLADGSLPEPRQAELRAQVQGSPEMATALAEQQRAVSMLRALDQPAPASLRASVEEMTGAGDRVGGEHRARRPRVRWRRALVLPGATALAVVIAAIVILAGGGAATPTVPQAARLALAAATGPAPQVDSTDPGQLNVSAAGIAFPNWATTSRWAPSGMRTDRVGGRTVTTVFYRNPKGVEVGYSISSGAPLPGAHGTTVPLYGATFTLQHIGGGNFITWVRAGHTCVIAGHAVPYATLLALAGADGREAIGSRASVHHTKTRSQYL